MEPVCVSFVSGYFSVCSGALSLVVYMEEHLPACLHRWSKIFLPEQRLSCHTEASSKVHVCVIPLKPLDEAGKL